MNSPALIVGAWPTTVIRSRTPHALTRRTQKPLSGLWNVTRSTRPARPSRCSRAAVDIAGYFGIWLLPRRARLVSELLNQRSSLALTAGTVSSLGDGHQQ